jgi:hypothetical protein
MRKQDVLKRRSYVKYCASTAILTVIVVERGQKNGPHLRGPISGGAKTGGQFPASPAFAPL